MYLVACILLLFILSFIIIGIGEKTVLHVLIILLSLSLSLVCVQEARFDISTC